MIIYKIQKNGRATDFQFALKCPEGFKSIKGDRIPEDITPFHEQRYIDALAISDQKKECIRLLNDSEKSVSNDPPYPDDVQTWKMYRAELRLLLKSDKLGDIPKKPF